jgi:mRNA interferase MazF
MGVKQYQIVLVNLGFTQGSEIRKIRPCAILSPDEMNEHLNTVVIAPLTTSGKHYPSRIKVRLDDKRGLMALDQIRAIDKGRIIKELGHLSDKEIGACKRLLREIFVE